MSDEEDPCTITETTYEKPSDGNGVHVGENGVHVPYQPEEESYVDRVKSSCGMIIVGLILFVGSFPLLGWNEKRAVER